MRLKILKLIKVDDMLKRTTKLQSTPGSLKRGSGTLSKGSKLKARKPTKEQLEQRKGQRDKDFEFYTQIWHQRGPYSEVSGSLVGSEISSAYFHHILPKHRWPELRYVSGNIIVLTIGEHAQVEQDMYKFPEVNRRREKLIEG